MKNENGKSLPSQIFIGAAVILFGVLFLLDNLDIIEFRRAMAFWPAVLILVGVIKLVDTRSPSGRMIGVILVGAGILLTMGRLGYANFNLRTLWPLAIIGVGSMVVYQALKGRKTMGMPLKYDQESDSVVDVTAVLGGFDRRITTPNFRGGEVTAIMGGCQLDLRGSSIEGEAVVNVFAAMGGITFKVPPDWTVILHGSPIMGGFDEKTITPPHNEKRLIITGYAIMGGVEVRN